MSLFDWDDRDDVDTLTRAHVCPSIIALPGFTAGLGQLGLL